MYSPRIGIFQIEVNPDSPSQSGVSDDRVARFFIAANMLIQLRLCIGSGCTSTSRYGSSTGAPDENSTRLRAFHSDCRSVTIGGNALDKNGAQLFDASLEIVVFEDASAGATAEAFAQLGVVHQLG